MDKMKVAMDLKKLLISQYGDEIKKVILFGSRVYGKATEYSDYDFLVVLKNDFDWKKKHEIWEISSRVDIENDVVTDIRIISENELNHSAYGKLPFIQDALYKGIVV